MMQTPQAQTQTYKKDVGTLTILEQKIAENLPLEVFDYPYILTPESYLEIILTSPLTTKQLDILSDYNSFTQKFFQNLGIKIEIPETDTFKKFLELSRNIYLFRFVEARTLFAQYSLFTVPTLGAIHIARESGDYTENTLSVEINIPDSMVINNDGLFDFEQTLALEEKTNLIKSTLSSFSNFLDLANKSIPDLLNITTRGFLISINESIILEIMQVVLQNLIIETNKLVYNYISRGYSPVEASDNVRDLLIKTTPKSGILLPESLKHMQKSTEEIIRENINDNILLDPKTKEDLFQEIMELIIHYSTQGEFISPNMYKLEFIHYSDLPPDYKNYHHIIEVYLLDDIGDTLSTPNEAYDIDFSRTSKEALFRLVTNGFENPNLTLNDYLYRV